MREPLQNLRNWKLTRLSDQIIIPAVLVTISFLAILGFVAFFLGQQAVETQVSLRNRRISALVAGEVTTFFENLVDNVRSQERYLIAKEHSVEALANLRRHFPKTYSKLWLINAQGQQTFLLSDSNAADETFKITKLRPKAAKELGAEVGQALKTNSLKLSPVAFYPITKRPYITLTLPLATDGLTNAGALVAQVDLRSFWAKVDAIQIEQGSVRIIDQRGVILAHPDRNLVGQTLQINELAQVFRGFEDSVTYTEKGITYLAAYSPIRGSLNWGVIVEQQRAVALAPVQIIGLTAIITTGLSALIVVLLLSSLVHRAVKPVEALSQFATKIALSNDLSHDLRNEKLLNRAPTSEIKALFDSFNQMLSRLNSAQEQLLQWNSVLEERVTKRTAQLQTVLEVARLSTVSLQKLEILSTTLEQLERIVHYDLAAVMLLDKSEKNFESLEIDAKERKIQQVIRSIDEYQLNLAVMQEATPINIADTTQDSRWVNLPGMVNLPCSWLGVPLIVKKRPIGVLGLLKRQPNFYREEDITLVTALMNQVAVTLAHACLHKESVQRMERELAQAEQIQRHLFPKAAPPIKGIAAATFYRATRETTGDFYEFIVQHVADDANPPQKLGVIVGDVSGKSLPAALMMTMARTAVCSAARLTPLDPAQVLQTANQTLLGDVPKGSFVASSYALFDMEEYQLLLSNAAQPAPILVRDGQTTLLEGTGCHFPLSIIATATYETLQIALKPHDLVIFYTDGVVEAQNIRQQLFSFERFCSIISSCSSPEITLQQVLERIILAVANWVGEAPQSDDIAIVALRVLERKA